MKKEECKQYIVDFCNEVKKDFPQLIIYPPKSRFYKKLKHDDCYRPRTKTVFISLEGNSETLKTTIRHECLHHILCINNLPAHDEDDLFLNFAVAYNAHPYGLVIHEAKRNPTRALELIDKIYDNSTNEKISSKIKSFLQDSFLQCERKGHYERNKEKIVCPGINGHGNKGFY